jgi:Tfp pilus assembly protein PilF
MSRLKPIALSVVCAFSMAGCAGLSQKQAEQPPAAQPLRAAHHGPVTAEGMYRLGRYWEGQGRVAQAIVAYSEALKRDPLLVEAYTRLGMALASQRRYEEAVRQFQAAAVLEPQAASAHNNLGYAYLLSGSTEQAVKAFEEARRLDPGHEKARENLRIARAKAGETSARPAVAQAPRAVIHGDGEPANDLRLVEVMPHVFELKAPARKSAIESRPLPAVPHNTSAIEARPLKPLLQKASAAAPARGFRLEVSNGNGVLGLAKRVAGRLAQAGVPATRLTNQRPFAQARTEIQYRAGYAAEAARLAGKLQRPVNVAPSTHLADHVDVRLVLGKDAPTESALLVPRSERTMTAGVAGGAR